MAQRTISRKQSISRRNLVGHYTLAAFAVLQNTKGATAHSSRRPAEVGDGHAVTLVDHPRGHYSFLRGISAYSGGVVARNGYEIVHATFSRAPSFRDGFEPIREHLSRVNLPKVALCAVELRSPLALSSEEFGRFNSSYIEVLRSWGILLEDGLNPVARTNVAPVLFPPREPSIFGFSYTARSTALQRTFIVAGGGELPDGSINPTDIIRRGDATSEALAEKARYVMTRMSARLRGMGVSWREVTAINVYTAHDLSRDLVAEILNQAGNNAVIWNYSHPPIKDLEFEMDLRGVQREIVLG